MVKKNWVAKNRRRRKRAWEPGFEKICTHGIEERELRFLGGHVMKTKRSKGSLYSWQTKKELKCDRKEESLS